MRKSFLLFVSLFPLLLFAQKGFHIGASGTFSSTFIYTQNNYGTLLPFTKGIVRASEMDYKLTWGGNGGIVLGYNFEPWVGLQAEIQYNSTGQKYEDNFVGPAEIPEGTFGSSDERVNVKRNIRLSYVRIPVLVKFTTNKGHVAKFYGAFGPQIGIRTSAKESVTIAGYDYINESLAYTSDQKFQRMDVSIALQLGTEIYATDNLYFNIGISGFVGVLDINGKVLRNYYSKNDASYQKSYITNAGLVVGVHYIIGEGRRDF